MLIPITNMTDISSVQQSLNNLYYEITKRLIIHMSYSLKNENESINKVYSFLNKQMEIHMRFGQTKLISPEVEDCDIDLMDIWVKVRVLEEFLQKGNTIKVIEMINEITMELKKKRITLRQLTLFVRNMYYALTYKMQQVATMGNTITTIDEDFSRLRELTSFDELSKWLEDLVICLLNNYCPREVVPKNQISSVIQWIHNNYQENLLFQDFANKHHVSLSYLSREFKNQTGYKFSDYLMRYRVEKAKQFLEAGIERTGEVGLLVGYLDAKHFSSIFKRIEGVSPSQYKKKYINEE
jgi:two-component system, response regulator YesN